MVPKEMRIKTTRFPKTLKSDTTQRWRGRAGTVRLIRGRDATAVPAIQKLSPRSPSRGRCARRGRVCGARAPVTRAPQRCLRTRRGRATERCRTGTQRHASTRSPASGRVPGVVPHVPNSQPAGEEEVAPGWGCTREAWKGSLSPESGSGFQSWGRGGGRGFWGAAPIPCVQNALHFPPPLPAPLLPSPFPLPPPFPPLPHSLPPSLSLSENSPPMDPTNHISWSLAHSRSSSNAFSPQPVHLLCTQPLSAYHIQAPMTQGSSWDRPKQVA